MAPIIKRRSVGRAPRLWTRRSGNPGRSGARGGGGAGARGPGRRWPKIPMANEPNERAGGEFGATWPNFAPSLDKFDRSWPRSAEIGPNLSRNRPSPGQRRPKDPPSRSTCQPPFNSLVAALSIPHPPPACSSRRGRGQMVQHAPSVDLARTWPHRGRQLFPCHSPRNMFS